MGKKSKKTGSGKAESENLRRRKRRRRSKNTLYFLLVGFFAAAVLVMLSLTVFFKIEYIEVKGNDRYSQTELISASGIRPGDNLFRVDKAALKEKLQTNYPYIEDVKFERILPSTAVIVIRQAVPIGTFVQSDGSYALVSGEARILESGVNPTSVYVIVKGVEIADRTPGSYLPETAGEEFVTYEYVYAALEETEFGAITELDLGDILNIKILYENRILIELGSVSDLSKKLAFAKYALETTVERSFEGVMDLRIPGELRYRPNKPALQEKPSEEQPSDTPETGDASPPDQADFTG